MGQSVLVTGASGFLGHWVVEELLRRGHQVTSLVRKNSDTRELLQMGSSLAYGDVTNVASLSEAFKGKSAVFHLAGLIAYRKSDRAAMEQVNVLGTKNVLQACEEQKITKLIHLSSVVAIGAGFSSKDVLNEDSPYNVGNLNLGYFETKKKAEVLVQEWHRNKRGDVVILNPSTIYGAGDAEKGSRKTQIKVAKGKFPFYTRGGVNVVAVEDVVQGIMSAWEKGRSGERYILCGENLLIRDVFQMIAQAAGVKPPGYALPSWVLQALGFLGDQATALGFKGSLSRENAWTATLYHWFSSEKAQRELDFKPRKAKFAIENSVRWMKEKGIIEL